MEDIERQRYPFEDKNDIETVLGQKDKACPQEDSMLFWSEGLSLSFLTVWMQRRLRGQHDVPELDTTLCSIRPGHSPGSGPIPLGIGGPLWQKHGVGGVRWRHSERHGAGWTRKHRPPDEQRRRDVRTELPQSGHQGRGHRACAASRRYWHHTHLRSQHSRVHIHTTVHFTEGQWTAKLVSSKHVSEQPRAPAAGAMERRPISFENQTCCHGYWGPPQWASHLLAFSSVIGW